MMGKALAQVEHEKMVTKIHSNLPHHAQGYFEKQKMSLKINIFLLEVRAPRGESLEIGGC